MDNIIEVKNLSKSFAEIQAVNNISFTVKKGEIFGFLGPNGAGKTTTTRMLTGVFPPDSGRIIIAGYDLVKNNLEARMKIGVVPELANAYLDLTALENILFMAEMYGLTGKSIKKKAKELLARFGLKQRSDDKIKKFSKGMTQRVVLAMALINDPRLLFLDEPTSGLDVQSTRLIRSVIRDLNNSGTTVFITTHDINEANNLCDRLAIMNQGQLAAIDSPENLKSTFKKSQSVEVSFSRTPEFLQDLKSTDKIEKRGDKFRLFTVNPGKTITEIVKIIEETDNSIKTLQTLGPELEDVFVSLTGGELVDGD